MVGYRGRAPTDRGWGLPDRAAGHVARHFPEPVVLEAVRPIGARYECRVRLPDGSPDEAILSIEEAELLFGQASPERVAHGRSRGA
jgi:hypothetical protein